MAKIGKREVTCTCCKNKVEIEYVMSYYSNTISLDGNKFNSLQYKIQECPVCHYTAIDISDESVRASRGMLNAFRVKPVYEKIADKMFVSLLKAADIYEKNKKYSEQAYMLRLASFYALEMKETSISRNLLRASNTVFEKYFNELEVLSLGDVSNAVILIDCNRQLGMLNVAGTMCEDLLSMLDAVEQVEQVENIKKVLQYEKNLIDNRDLNIHYVSEAW